MNEKITTSELAELLAKRTRMTTEEAATFIRRAFSLVTEILQEEKYLKIKDLGTFKLISVSSRESVAVNTGERILIEGYDKISFTPENGLRDLINKPFAHFETISLNEGVDFEEEVAEPEEETIEEEEAEEVSKPQEKPKKPVSKTAGRKKLIKPEEEEEEAPKKNTISSKKGGVGKEKAALEEERRPIAPGAAPVSKEAAVTPRKVLSKPASSKNKVPESEEGTDPVAKKAPLGRVKPRLIRPQEEEMLSTAERKVSKPETEEEQPVVVPQRAEIRKRKSILKQEVLPDPVSGPEPEESKVIVQEKSSVFRRKYETEELPGEEDLYDTEDEELAEEELYSPDEEGVYDETKQEFPGEEDYPGEEDFPEEQVLSFRKRRSFAVPFFICLSLLILIIGAITVSYLYYPQWLKDILHDEGQSITIITVDSPTEIEKTEEEAASIVAAEPVEQAPKVEVQAEKEPVGNVPLVAGDRANPKDFKITGTLTTVTIEGGSSLARLAKQYYGSRDLWTFIVESNKDIITDPDNIPVGKTIKIPKLEKK